MGRRIILARVALEKEQDFESISTQVEEVLEQVGAIPVDKHAYIEKASEDAKSITFQLPIETDVAAAREDIEEKFEKSSLILDYEIEGELEDGFVF